MPASGMRDCPFCTEPVRIAAVLCPHCRSDLPPFKYAKPKKSGNLGTILSGSCLAPLASMPGRPSNVRRSHPLAPLEPRPVIALPPNTTRIV